MEDRSRQISKVLRDLSEDAPKASARLLQVLYEELRELAEKKLAREPSDHTLQATALVHEAYLRLLGNGSAEWDNRGHFFAAAAEAMRRILVERARKYARLKHGGGQRRVDLEPDLVGQQLGENSPDDLLALDAALTKFEAQEPDRAAVVRLRYFAGLSIDQAADVLGISATTANRYWAYARAWLCDAVTHDDQ